jgi:hypothetical protein
MARVTQLERVWDDERHRGKPKSCMLSKFLAQPTVSGITAPTTPYFTLPNYSAVCLDTIQSYHDLGGILLPRWHLYKGNLRNILLSIQLQPIFSIWHVFVTSWKQVFGAGTVCNKTHPTAL